MINSTLTAIQNGAAAIGNAVLDKITSHPIVHDVTALFNDVVAFKSKASKVKNSVSDAAAFLMQEAPAVFKRVAHGAHKKPEEVQKHLKKAPNLEGFYQLLAQEVSYLKWERGTLLNASKLCATPQYKVQELVHFAGGISGVVLVAKDEAPIIALRGTDATDIDNLKDDLHEKIGALNCTKYAKELEALIHRVRREHGRIHIMGHSYGGTVAQRLTIAFPEHIQRCTYHNAPGVGREALQEYERNLAALPNGVVKPSVWSYRHAKDIPSLLGGDHLPTDPGCNFTASTRDDKIAYVDAHSANTISDGKQLFVGQQVSSSNKKFAAFLESARKDIAKMLQLSRACP